MKFKDIRKSKGLTQKELASRLGTSQQNLSQYENGKRIPKLSTMRKMSLALQVPLSEIMSADEFNSYSPSIEEIPIIFDFEIKDPLFYARLVDPAFEKNSHLSYFTDQEMLFLKTFRKLNDDNKQKVSEYMEFLESKQEPYDITKNPYYDVLQDIEKRKERRKKREERQDKE